MARIQNPTLQLPSERLGQIKRIAEALGGLSISDTVGHLVRQEIERGTIEKTLPGIEIKHSAPAVVIAFDGGAPLRLTPEGAECLAKTIIEFTLGYEAKTTIDMTHKFAVARKGSGIKVTLPAFGGVTKTFSRDVATDLAKLIEAEAKLASER